MTPNQKPDQTDDFVTPEFLDALGEWVRVNVAKMYREAMADPNAKAVEDETMTEKYPDDAISDAAHGIGVKPEPEAPTFFGEEILEWEDDTWETKRGMSESIKLRIGWAWRLEHSPGVNPRLLAWTVSVFDGGHQGFCREILDGHTMLRNEEALNDALIRICRYAEDATRAYRDQLCEAIGDKAEP